MGELIMSIQESARVLESYKDIELGKGRDCNEFFDELLNRYSEMLEDEEVPREDIKNITGGA